MFFQKKSFIYVLDLLLRILNILLHKKESDKMDHANLRRPIHAVRPDLEILLDFIFIHVVPILILATILTGNYRLLQKEENIPCPALKINYQNTNENHLTSKLPYGLRLKAKICKNFNITCPRHLQVNLYQKLFFL